jgi:hypothetical protein
MWMLRCSKCHRLISKPENHFSLCGFDDSKILTFDSPIKAIEFKNEKKLRAQIESVI